MGIDGTAPTLLKWIILGSVDCGSAVFCDDESGDVISDHNRETGYIGHKPVDNADITRPTANNGPASPSPGTPFLMPVYGSWAFNLL